MSLTRRDSAEGVAVAVVRQRFFVCLVPFFVFFLPFTLYLFRMVIILHYTLGLPMSYSPMEGIDIGEITLL